VLRPSDRSLARLLSLLEDGRRVARISPQVFAADEARRSLEQSLLRAAIACLEDCAPGLESATEVRRARIMARFEQVTEAIGDRPLHVPELCKLIGVPERTLRKCCQQHLGMSPHQFLLRRRILLARRALLRGDSSAGTVTSIAARHGFWELGRFSALYRSMFGEVPSATLRRSA
jgi:AraC-like DNA-binding protein